MKLSIYSPQVLALSRRDGITELQAYRALQARKSILARGKHWLAAKIERQLDAYGKSHPDFNLHG